MNGEGRVARGRRRLFLFTAWVIATASATVVVSAGVDAVRSATRANTSALLVAETAAPDDSLEATAEPTRRTSTTAATSSTTTTTSTAEAGGTLTGVPAESSRPPSTPSTPSAPPPPTTAPTSTSVPTPSSSTTPATTAAAPSEVAAQNQTILTPGGTATIRFHPERVEVQLATPNPGYTVEISQRGPTEVRVEFDDDDNRYRMHAWWSDGPRHSVESK